MTFSEVREYQPGDDVRSIDWNVTARLNKPYIKVFEEEREMTVMLLVDVSGSRNFGTQTQMKRDMMAEVAATLAFSTIENNDKIGVIFFSDKIEKYIPAKKGKKHVLHIIRELIDFQPEANGTDIAGALQYFSNAQKRRCTAFLISDFIEANNAIEMQPRRGFYPQGETGERLKQPLLIAANRHDISAIQIYDRRDAELPNVGLLKIKDAETGERIWIDTALESTRTAYATRWNKQQESLADLFTRTGTRNVSVRTDEDYVIALRRLFKN